MTKQDVPADVAVVSLNSLVLDPTGDLQRDPPFGARIERPDDPRYDRHTVFYDAYRTAAGGRVTLHCPKLLNLGKPVRHGLVVDGARPRALRHKRYLRHDEITVAASATAQIGLKLGDKNFEVMPQTDEGTTFEGLDCLVALQKNNQLDWIESWARFHVNAHGVTGILLFDNGSTSPPPDAIAAAFAKIKGLQVARVVRAPFPYGVKISSKLSPTAQYLQQAMLNLARNRFLCKAAGVLAVDIDELVKPLPDGTVFDAARTSRFGLHVFKGTRVYPDDPAQPAPQHAHRNSLPAEPSKVQKWCLIPDRIANRFPWAVHRSGGPFTGFCVAQAPGFWHCESTTTNWKGHRLVDRQGLQPDDDLQRAIATYLPVPSDF